MPWEDFPEAQQSVSLLTRSIDRGRLGHAYLFTGESPDRLERVAGELAMTVNCQGGLFQSRGRIPTTACGTCSACRRIREGIHPDVHWLRAESKSRIIRIEQVRELIQAIQLKPTEGRLKVGVLVGADRLNPQAANAFLKTLEEPPPASLLILLTTEPDRLLETVLSRCLRLSVPGESGLNTERTEWVGAFARELQQPPKSLLSRYRVLDILLRRLAELRAGAESDVEARSPAHRFKEADSALLEQWEEEAKAAVEAEYRLRRSLALRDLQSWFRDIWMATLSMTQVSPILPGLESLTQAVAARLTPAEAVANLRRMEETQALLNTNVQEALALEVTLLRLHL
ncbi:MAG: hypothetical protein JNK85_21875 [Verrucomicrobiales bacterium]|nr:hypothetical protein [Verrucomicrobiales bacterium]